MHKAICLLDSCVLSPISLNNKIPRRHKIEVVGLLNYLNHRLKTMELLILFPTFYFIYVIESYIDPARESVYR